MTKQFKKNIISLLVLLLLFSFFVPTVKATEETSSNLFKFKEAIGLPGSARTSPVEIIFGVINMLLGLLGLFFVILIMYAGFLYMTAQGDEKKVTKAKDTIKNAVIGVALILLAYLISRTVFTLILGAITPDAPTT